MVFAQFTERVLQVILYEKTGNYKDALKCAREYVKTYPDDKEMKKEVRFIKTRI